MDRPLLQLQTASLALFEAARNADQHEVAYHALAAMLHAAEALDDAAACAEVERLANESRLHIDHDEPGHKLSSSTAHQRGHESIYKQLALTAVSARLRIEAHMARRNAKGARGRPLDPSAG